MSQIAVVEFTDPGCPFAYSACPALLRLRWRFGADLDWSERMVVLAEEAADYEAKGLTPAMALAGARSLAAEHGMPFELRLRDRVAGTAPACRAVVGRRLRDPRQASRLLRELRIAQFSNHDLDDEATIVLAARAAGLDADEVLADARTAAAAQATEEDKAAARDPHPAALAQDHKLAPWEGGRRYTCPSLELTYKGTTAAVPGFQPIEAYEAVLANLVPDVRAREAPASTAEVLAWAGHPLATAEVAAVLGVDREAARARLADEGATELPFGTDAFWTSG